MKEHHGLFETYLSKLEKARKRWKKGFIVSSIGETTDNIVGKKWLNDIVIMELNYRIFKLETIIQVIFFPIIYNIILLRFFVFFYLSIDINFQVLSHERIDRQAKLKFTDEFSSITSNLYDSLNIMYADLIDPADLDEDIA